MRPSKAQREVLVLLESTERLLVRRSGGFWCLADDDNDAARPRAWQKGEWWTGTNTVTALTRRGWVELVSDGPEWCSPRRLTEAGRAAAG